MKASPTFHREKTCRTRPHLHRYSVLTALAIHMGNPETTLVHGEVPVALTLDPWGAYRIPDLIVVPDCDVALVEEQGGYAIDRQGEAPDFVLEVASRSTAETDYTDKRADYERFGIGEYWRFDPSGGEYHDTRPSLTPQIGLSEGHLQHTSSVDTETDDEAINY